MLNERLLCKRANPLRWSLYRWMRQNTQRENKDKDQEAHKLRLPPLGSIFLFVTYVLFDSVFTAGSKYQQARVSKMSKDAGLKQPDHSYYSRPLSAATASKLLDKRKRSYQDSNTPCQSKGPAYWDNLSIVWLTRSALREFDRRNSRPDPKPEYHRPVTRQVNAKRRETWQPQFAPEFLGSCSPSCLERMKRLSRQGGLDLTDLRNVVYDVLI